MDELELVLLRPLGLATAAAAAQQIVLKISIQIQTPYLPVSLGSMLWHRPGLAQHFEIPKPVRSSQMAEFNFSKNRVAHVCTEPADGVAHRLVEQHVGEQQSAEHLH